MDPAPLAPLAEAAETARKRQRQKEYYANKKKDTAWMETRLARCREANRKLYERDREEILARARLARAEKRAASALERLASLQAVTGTPGGGGALPGPDEEPAPPGASERE